MKYQSIYNRIMETIPEPDFYEVDAANGFKFGGWDALRSSSFQPSENAAVNALIKAAGVTVVYDVTDQPGDMQGDANTPRTVPSDNENMPGTIHMPPRDAFIKSADYTHTLIHELSHAFQMQLRPISWGDVLSQSRSPDEALFIIMTQQPPNFVNMEEELIAETTAYLVSREIAPELPEERFFQYLRNWKGGVAAVYGEAEFPKMYEKIEERITRNFEHIMSFVSREVTA